MLYSAPDELLDYLLELFSDVLRTGLGSIHYSQCCPKKVTDPGRQIGDRLLH